MATDHCPASAPLPVKSEQTQHCHKPQPFMCTKVGYWVGLRGAGIRTLQAYDVVQWEVSIAAAAGLLVLRSRVGVPDRLDGCCFRTLRVHDA